MTRKSNDIKEDPMVTYLLANLAGSITDEEDQELTDMNDQHMMDSWIPKYEDITNVIALTRFLFFWKHN